MSDRREPNAEAFHLGHFEQMNVAIALRLALDEVREVPGEDRAGVYRNLDEETLNQLSHLFGTPGTMTIIKNIEEL